MALRSPPDEIQAQVAKPYTEQGLLIMSLDKKKLRQQMILKRQQLSLDFINHAANQQQHLLSQLPCYQQATTIACYLAVKQEACASAIIEQARLAGKAIYLPIIHPQQARQLLFARYNEDTVLVKSRFNILEPQRESAELIDPLALDIVITPLVAFDTQRHRLGMGGGFYDTTFAKLTASTQPKPKLIGLAYECQKVDSLETESWDIPLSHIVTEAQCY